MNNDTQPSLLMSASSFQNRTSQWVAYVLGEPSLLDVVERRNRFAEEAIELFQACGGTAADMRALTRYTFSRPVGEPAQEMGGVVCTLNALGVALQLPVEDMGEVELARAWTIVEKVRAKYAARVVGSPLPGIVIPALEGTMTVDQVIKVIQDSAVDTPLSELIEGLSKNWQRFCNEEANELPESAAEWDYYILDHAMQLDFEMIDNNGSVFVANSRQIVALVSPYKVTGDKYYKLVRQAFGKDAEVNDRTEAALLAKLANEGNVDAAGRVPYWPYCSKCHQPFDFATDEGLAFCNCGTTEWGTIGRPQSWVPDPAPKPVANPTKLPVYTHKKTGKEYKVLGPAKMQCDVHVTDMSEVEVYMGRDGKIWVRPIDEFFSRFAEVATEAPEVKK